MPNNMLHTEKYLFSIVIPAFNEEARIEFAVHKINEKIKDVLHEIIIVDDGSTDATREILERIRTLSNTVKVIHLSQNKGKGFALKIGFLEASGTYVLMTDADLSTPIETIFDLEEDLEKYDILIGSRLLKSDKKIEKGPISRRIIRRISRLIRKVLFNIDVTDTQCGFKIFTNKSAKEIAQRMTIDRYGADLEKVVIAQKLGFKIKEVPVDWLYDEKNSKINLLKDSYKTLREWIKIKENLIQNKYSQ